MAEIRRISSGGGAGYGGETFHGLRRDEDGLLYYKRQRLNATGATIDLTDGSVLDDADDAGPGGRNDAARKPGEVYDQWLIDIDRMNIYINDAGFLVLRLNESYTHAGPN